RADFEVDAGAVRHVGLEEEVGPVLNVRGGAGGIVQVGAFRMIVVDPVEAAAGRAGRIWLLLARIIEVVVLVGPDAAIGEAVAVVVDAVAAAAAARGLALGEIVVAAVADHGLFIPARCLVGAGIGVGHRRPILT